MPPQNQRREYQSPERLPAQEYTVPLQDQIQPQPQPQAPPPVSRRGLLRGGLIGGGLGLAVAAGTGAAVAVTGNSGQTLKPASKPVVMAPMAPNASRGPLVVFISDAATGVLDVYGGTGATRIHNPALVTQLLNNLK